MSNKARAMQLYCPNVEAMLACGGALGQALTAMTPPRGTPPAALLSGGLGAGKTTLTRGLVQGLPGGAEALVASPSFTLMNCYPTSPPVAHVDCYRLEPAMAMAVIPELLDDLAPGVLVVMEWVERLPEMLWPSPAVFLRWQETASEPASEQPAGRMLSISCLGAWEGAPATLQTALAPWLTGTG